MPSCMNFFVMIYVAVAISAIFVYPSRIPRTANDQVNCPVQDSGIFEEVFQYPDVFLRNYALMEKDFKIFAYPVTADYFVFYNETYIPGEHFTELIFYYSFIYPERRFYTNDEPYPERRFYTNDGTKAHMFFFPINWSQICKMGNYSTAENYVWRMINKYPHWNRSEGVDHFVVACGDAGVIFSERVPLNNSIKVLCSTSKDSRHNKYHHIALPQMRYPSLPPMPGYDIHHRTILACPKNPPASASQSDVDNYIEKFLASKYCICDGASSRICITDSIYFGCVPVILNEDYELPFGDILDWTKFSIIINENDADRVEQILEAISDSKFSELHDNTRKVQRHFYMDAKRPKPYDVFHMIMYELWLRHHTRSL